MLKESLTIINRYPGVKPFSSEEDFLFFGRQSEVEALNSLIFIKQTIVLYGKSGYGKSSLINAGIIPKLKENNEWFYFSVRFNNYSDKDTDQNLSPLRTLKQRLSENIKPENGNVLDKLIPNESSVWYWVKQHQLQNNKAKFIFFFDQFEELFTYTTEEIAEFSEQFADLLYNTLPLNYRNKVADAEEENMLSDNEYDFLYNKPEIKVVFSIRSDRLSLLNSLTEKHPSILKHCYELNALNIADAQQAIIEPAKLSQDIGFTTSAFSFTQRAIDKILKSVANPDDGKIEASTLQIVCRYVEDNLVKENNYSEINDEHLGDIADIFKQYYQGILSKLSNKEKLQAQHLIEDELIDGDKRNPLSATYIKSKFGLTEDLLTQLEQSSLLRKERDASGRILYEVSHDSLVSAIDRVAQNRREQEVEKRQFKQLLELEEERKRVAELEALKNKAELRYKVAFWISALLVFVLGFTVFLGVRSKSLSTEKERLTSESEKLKNELNEKERQKIILDGEVEKKKLELKKQEVFIEDAKKRADSITNQAKILQFNYNFEEAKKHLNFAERYINVNDKSAAFKELNIASTFLKTKDLLPTIQERDRKILLNEIEKKKKELITN